MTAHLLIPAHDAEHPATVSPRLITGLLREELGFDGLVVSDAVEMRAVRARYGLTGAAVRALAAGVDLICLGNTSGDAEFTALRTAIAQAVARGELSQDRLAEAAHRTADFTAWQRDLARTAAIAPPDRELGLAAARRALRVTPPDAPALPLETAPVLVEFGIPGTVVQGDGVPWGLGPALSSLLPGTVRVALPADAPYNAARTHSIAAQAVGRPVVIAVRDAHRRPAVGDWLRALLTRRPDAIIVELGFPRPGLDGGVRIDTHGAARVCGQAAAEALAGRTLPRT